MNRLVLIGNGFDLAHGLKTSYQDFINWYWDERLHSIILIHEAVSADELCSLKILPVRGCEDWHLLAFYNSYFKDLSKNEWTMTGKEFIEFLKSKPNNYEVTYSPFFERIIKSIETKNWVDIENEYYDLLKQYVLEKSDVTEIENLNKQLHFLQEKLVKYLSSIEIPDKLLNTGIRQKIYAPFIKQDISIEGMNALIEHVESGFERDDIEWRWMSELYGYKGLSKNKVDEYKQKYEKNNDVLNEEEPPLELLLPNQIMLLNFNYTHTADLYCRKGSFFSVNQIHGDLDNPSSIIFGYGDELDKDYKTIVDRNDNRFLGNIKSIKYLESDKYRRVLSFIESEPYQIIIMGHSCGNSDRTLLNTLFEHKNCVSIKPYYHQISKDEDNYIEIVQNISRNFKDMKLMRDRVVNKIYCKPLTEKLS